MLAVFNKRKDSIKTIKDAKMLERQMNAIYFSMMKKLDDDGEKLIMERDIARSNCRSLISRLEREEEKRFQKEIDKINRIIENSPFPY